MPPEFTKQLQPLNRKQIAAGAVALLVLGAVLYGFLHLGGEAPKRDSDISSQSRNQTTYKPTPTEWASLTVEPVTERTFRAEHVTEGKIAVDEDRSTPVFSPYTGRVVKLLVKPGDTVKQRQPLFVIEAADTVQAQNDFITAINGLNKAKSALDLAQLQDTRAKDLFQGKAVPQKDYEQAQATFVQAQSDMRSAQTALDAARNKLKIFSASATTRSRISGRRAPSIRTPRCSHRSPAPWCSGRSGPASTSTPAPAIRLT